VNACRRELADWSNRSDRSRGTSPSLDQQRRRAGAPWPETPPGIWPPRPGRHCHRLPANELLPRLCPLPRHPRARRHQPRPHWQPL